MKNQEKVHTRGRVGKEARNFQSSVLLRKQFLEFFTYKKLCDHWSSHSLYYFKTEFYMKHEHLWIQHVRWGLNSAMYNTCYSFPLFTRNTFLDNIKKSRIWSHVGYSSHQTTDLFLCYFKTTTLIITLKKKLF